jgi:hypothetical protein
MNTKFLPLILLASLLLGCGGGGGGGGGVVVGGENPQSTVYEKTITSFNTTGRPLTNPRLMTVSGAGLLTVVDQASIVTFNTTNAKVASEYPAINPFGVALKPGTSDVYYTSGAIGNQGVFLNGVQVPIPSTNANLYGIAFTTAQDWYVANVAGSVLIYQNNSRGNPISVPVPTGLPSALVANNGLIYVSLAGRQASILSFNPSNSTDPINHGFSTLPWGTFDFPNGMAIDGDYAYIANAGNENGDNGYVSRVKISDGSKEVFASNSVGVWRTAGVGFCGPAGLAIFDKYLYVSNTTCSNGINQNQILKIKLQ